MKEHVMKKVRKQFGPAEKLSILREHLLDGVTVSEVCSRRGIKPSMFYRWQKQLFENGEAAFTCFASDGNGQMLWLSKHHSTDEGACHEESTEAIWTGGKAVDIARAFVGRGYGVGGMQSTWDKAVYVLPLAETAV